MLAGIAPGQRVLSAGRGERGQSRSDAADRRTVPADPVLRGTEDDRLAAQARLRGESQTSASIDAPDGIGSDLSEAAAVGTGARAPDLSVPVAQSGDCASRSGVGQRHHLHSIAPGIHLSGGDHGLVQPVRSGLGSLHVVGHRILSLGRWIGRWNRRSRRFSTRIRARSSPA